MLYKVGNRDKLFENTSDQYKELLEETRNFNIDVIEFPVLFYY